MERAEAFIAAFRELIAATDVDPARSCEAACRRGPARIGDTVDYITVCNLANLDAAIHGLLLDVIEVQLKFVGKGFALDMFTDATAILEGIHRPFLNFLKEQRLH